MKNLPSGMNEDSLLLDRRQDKMKRVEGERAQLFGLNKINRTSLSGRGLIESIQQDGSRYRVDRRGIHGLNLFTYGQNMMFWTTVDDGRS